MDYPYVSRNAPAAVGNLDWRGLAKSQYDDPTHIARRRRISAYLRPQSKLANPKHPLRTLEKVPRRRLDSDAEFASDFVKST